MLNFSGIHVRWSWPTNQRHTQTVPCKPEQQGHQVCARWDRYSSSAPLCDTRTFLRWIRAEDRSPDTPGIPKTVSGSVDISLKKKASGARRVWAWGTAPYGSRVFSVSAAWRECWDSPASSSGDFDPRTRDTRERFHAGQNNTVDKSVSGELTAHRDNFPFILKMDESTSTVLNKNLRV